MFRSCDLLHAGRVILNGEAGRPLLVSLLLYLDDAWPRDWAAGTLFLDTLVGHHITALPGAEAFERLCIPDTQYGCCEYAAVHSCKLCIRKCQIFALFTGIQGRQACTSVARQ